MADWSKRFLSSFRFMRVSRKTGTELSRISNIKTGGTIERNQDTQYETGTIDFVGTLNIGSDLLRIYLDATFSDGTVSSEPLGTFVVSTPKHTKTGSVSSGSAELSGRLCEIAEDEFDTPRVIPANTNAVKAAKDLLQEAGFEVVADTSPFTLSSAWVCGVGDSENELSTRLGAVNSLLRSAGFVSAFSDPMGRILLRRYTEPQSRAVALNLSEGTGARFESSATDELDTSKVANVVHVDYSTTDESVRGTAIDSDPNSAYSTTSRGWRKVATYSYSELPAGKTKEERQEAANAKAQELLKTQQSVIHRVIVRHIYAPVAIGDAVDISWPSAGIFGKFAIRKMTFSLVGGCPIEMEVRRYER